jgi:hypothetical protein
MMDGVYTLRFVGSASLIFPVARDFFNLLLFFLVIGGFLDSADRLRNMEWLVRALCLSSIRNGARHSFKMNSAGCIRCKHDDLSMVGVSSRRPSDGMLIASATLAGVDEVIHEEGSMIVVKGISAVAVAGPQPDDPTFLLFGEVAVPLSHARAQLDTCSVGIGLACSLCSRQPRCSTKRTMSPAM